MKFKIRILSTFLAVLFMLGSLSVLATVSAAAADPAPVTSEKYNVRVQKDYVQRKKFSSPEEKLASMNLVLTKFGYELYNDPVSGEVAMVEVANRHNVIFTNPYDIASSSAADGAASNGTSSGTKEQILSQIVVTYSEVSKDQKSQMYSFVEAAMRGQIEALKIRNGIRVEYTIGREEMRKLVPRWIRAERFEELLLKPMQEAIAAGDWSDFYYKKFLTYYGLKDPDKEETETGRQQVLQNYPCTAEFPIYVFDTKATDKEISDVEGFIKEYCADTYSFEQMEEDHEECGYVAEDEEYPVFKMALEYTLSETGLSVRMSCNGLQYNMASYTLESISILPYMGAGNAKNPGYNFYPDGSGSLFDYQQLRSKQTSITAKIYGLDYAYHEISGVTYQKTIRMPVFGSVSTETIYHYNDRTTGEPIAVSNTVKTLDAILAEGYTSDKITTDTYKRGYVAVIEAGESLGSLQTYHAGALSEYASIMNFFNPKPKDSYDIADSISVTSSSTWTVVSDRKYTGNIRIHYQLLCDAEDGKELQAAAQASGGNYLYYDASWLGMAEAYRDYLVANKVLTKLESTELTADIPLYIEAFGAMKTQQTIATIPVNVMTPFTTFENVLTMYNDLSANGIRNVNFKLTGFANGGMYSTMPSSVSWVGKVGGKSGFKKLIEEAKKIREEDSNATLGIYPDFDFAYSTQNKLFDSLNLKKDAIRTIDNRYTSKRIYSATLQKYVSFFQLAISPSRYSKFYTKLIKNYGKYELNTMSIASLGSTLNSDFDEDDPYNREDNKDFTVKALEDLKEAGYSLMTEGGNAYTWGYVDHIINADLDSSRYTQASSSVPFLGTVLHGYIQFAGAPLNQEGDTDYAILKAIENGAGLYFILSYQNTSYLKEDNFLSQYYSINYDIWKEDVISYYNTLNNLIRDVQSKAIIDHKFLNYSDGYGTTRVLDVDELQAQMEKELKEAKEKAQRDLEMAEIAKTAAVAEAMVAIRSAESRINALLASMTEQNVEVKKLYSDLKVTALAQQLKGTVDKPEDASKNVTFFKTAAINAMVAYSKLSYYNSQITEVIADLDNELEIIKEAVDGTERSYQYTEAAAIVNEIKSSTTIPASAQSEMNKFRDYMASSEKFEDGVNSLVAEALQFLSDNEEKIPADSYEAFTFEEIKAAGVYTAPVEETEENTGNVSTTYLVDNNRVIAVTYGESDENRNKTPFKTFLLNYNNFTVRTTYNGVEYTIPAYGYVVLYH